MATATVTGSLTGSSGVSDIQLNNAATEATLRMILQSLMTANRQSIDNIKTLAQRSGLDIDTINRTSQSLSNVQTNSSVLSRSFRETSASVKAVAEDIRQRTVALTEQLTSGNVSISNLFDAFKGLPYGIGKVAEGFSYLAKIQDSYVKSYQNLASSGAVFTGSLTDMRLSASKTFLTLDEFSSVVKNNTDVFRSLDGDITSGVKKFVAIQNSLLAPGSEVQKNLAYLGVSSQEAADLTLSYIRSQGSMNKRGLDNQKEVTAAVSQYAQELTLLSSITGKSREELRKKLDEENAEAMWQSALNEMSPEKAAKMRQGLEMAMAQGGKPAMEAFKAMALGFPPMTEAARLYTATQQAGVRALESYVQTANDERINEEQAGERNRAALAKQIAEGAVDQKNLRTVLQASALSGTGLSQVLSDATKMQNMFMHEGKMLSEREIAQKLEEMAVKNKATSGEIAAADEATKKLNQLGQEILARLLPVFNQLQPVMLKLVDAFVKAMPGVLKFLDQLDVYLPQAIDEVRDNFDMLITAAKALAMAFFATKTAQMASGIGSLVGSGSLITGILSKLGKVTSIAAILGGVALDYNTDRLKREGKEKTAAYSDVASSALAWGGTGAMLGSAVPVVGTATGAVLGGLAGTAYGVYNNWDTLFKSTPTEIKNPKPEPAPEDKKQIDNTEEDSNKAMIRNLISEQMKLVTPTNEILTRQLETLNKQTAELLKYTRDSVDYAKQQVQAVKSLNGNVFAQ